MRRYFLFITLLLPALSLIAQIPHWAIHPEYTSIKMLVETCNKTLEKYKEIYFKIKGKSLDLNNPLTKFHYFQVYNIDQDFSWINISNIHTTLNTIIKEIVELVNPTQRCDDPKKLNEDSCEFLLSFINGLKKLFFTQKQKIESNIYLFF